MHEFWVALPPTIVAFTGLVVGILQSFRSKRNRVQAKKELGAIHSLVNSQLASLKADLSVANKRIVDLVAIIEGYKKREPT